MNDVMENISESTFRELLVMHALEINAAWDFTNVKSNELS